MTLNIASYSDDWRSRLLSTFAHTPFELRCGSALVRCESVEGFWQGLKWPDGSAERARVFGFWGLEAKLAGADAPAGYIDFCGQRVMRGGPEHHALAERAMRAKLDQNHDVQAALLATVGLPLTHDLIDDDGRPVLDSLTLPKAVFVETWTRLRDELIASRATASDSSNKVDAVFEGGGVRGIGLVGAISVVEAAGYVFENVAGTSAGAIVATLLAAGYSAAELKATIAGIDFRRITDRNAIGRIPLVGPIANLLGQLGIFEGDYFLQLMRDLLGRKGKKTFADFVIPESANDPQYRYRVQVVASDVTRGHMLVLPGDIRAYGMDPDTLEVALAVRMSMSIPLFFRPVRLKSRNPGEGTSLIVDGGLLSDFPVELFDPPPGPLPHPIWGFRLVESTHPQIERYAIRGAISYLEAIIGTATSAHDARYVDTHNFVRSILIPTLGVSAVNFDLTVQDKDNLYQSGVQAATAFLSTWDLQKYLAAYRSGAPAPTRRDLSTP